jgi:predicted RNA-binding protein with PUA-like domain
LRPRLRFRAQGKSLAGDTEVVKDRQAARDRDTFLLLYPRLRLTEAVPRQMHDLPGAMGGRVMVDESPEVGYRVAVVAISEPRREGGRAMAYWLVKSEPDDWSWDEQVAKGREGAEWTGIRNFAAQNNLRAMKKGEQAFFYHTGKQRAIVGIVKVIAEAHPDSTDSAWRAIDVAAVKKLPTPVTLEQIKKDKRLAGMALVRISRLSVQPVSDAEWRIICEMGGLG